MDYPGSRNGCLYLGIDAGMFKTSVCTSEGKRFSERSVVILHENSADSDGRILSGTQALEATDGNVKEALKNGLKDEDDVLIFKEYLTDLLEKHDIEVKNRNIYAILGVPSTANMEYKKNLLSLAMELFSGAMLVDELFCIAYKKDILETSMILDLGFSKTDIAIINGGIPQENDFHCLSCSGKDIDSEIVKLIKERWYDSIVTEELAREWKEEYGHLVSAPGACTVNIPLESGTVNESIDEEIQIACEFVVTDIVSGITRLLSEVETEIRESLRNNIHIFGGTSRLLNIGTFIENELKELGGARVSLDIDPVFGVAEGALELCRNMPAEFWEQIIAQNRIRI
ncbi:MAG: rod shape-determining protein [Methanolobus sp.]|nr:rod shape-determining protein [Methanolobus sp.]